MGFLLIILALGGVAAFYAASERKAATFPKPAALLGSTYLQVITSNKRLIITKHGQGSAWYVQKQDGEIVEQGNESDIDMAIEIGLPALLDRVGPDTALNFLFDRPAVTALVSRKANGFHLNYADARHETSKSEMYPNRVEAVRRVFELFKQSLEHVPVPTPDDPLPPPEGHGFGTSTAGISMNQDKTRFTVQDLEEWVHTAAPHVVAAVEADITDIDELADAVFGVTLDANTEGLEIDGVPWEEIRPAAQGDLDVILAGDFARVTPPDRWLAAALVGKVREEEGFSGVHNGWMWVVRPWTPPGDQAAEPHWEWLVFDGPRHLDSHATNKGYTLGHTAGPARQAALAAIGG